MTSETPARPKPYDGFYDRPFWEHTARHELRLPRCAACGRYVWPAAPICDVCLSPDLKWTAVSGKGKLLSWVVFHRQYFPGIPTPYNCILVELDEGPLLISNLTGVENDAIDFDMRVEVDFLDLPEGYTLPVFRVAAG